MSRQYPLYAGPNRDPYCCERMRDWCETKCPDHPDYCPDQPVRRVGDGLMVDWFQMPIDPEAGGGGWGIRFCPNCGAALPHKVMEVPA